MSTTELARVQAEEREIMDAWAHAYDTMMVSNALVYQLERAAFASWVAERVRAGGGELAQLSLLDAGCGNAQLTERLANAGIGRVTGLDLSPGMLAQARSRGIPGSAWVEGTIEDPPFEEGSFDVVVAAWVLHHMLDPHAFAGFAERVLRPGGWFFVLDFDATTTGERPDGPDLRRRTGDVVRAALRFKNRRRIAARVGPEVRFNRAHHFLGERELLAAVPGGVTERVPRAAVTGALLPVLVDDSALDRRLAALAAALDRRLGPAPGAFQWVAGRVPG